MAATATEGAVTSLSVTEGAPNTSVKGKVGKATSEKVIDISDFFEDDIDLKTGTSATWNGSEWTIN